MTDRTHYPAPGMRVRSRHRRIHAHPVTLAPAILESVRALKQSEPKVPIAGLIEGRIVHYVGTAPRHYAAIVADVIDPITGLCVLRVMPKDERPVPAVTSYYDASARTVESWHFIEREE